MKIIVADDDVRDILNFRLKFVEACKASELGELRISIPDDAVPEEREGPTLCVWEVRIEFDLAQPRGGLVFAGSASRGHPPVHCYTCGGGDRMWLPCVDSLTAASNPLELRVVIPRGYTVLCSVPLPPPTRSSSESRSPAAPRCSAPSHCRLQPARAPSRGPPRLHGALLRPTRAGPPGEERRAQREAPAGNVQWTFRTAGDDGAPCGLPARAVGLAAGPFLRLDDPGAPGRLAHSRPRRRARPRPLHAVPLDRPARPRADPPPSAAEPGRARLRGASARRVDDDAAS